MAAWGWGDPKREPVPVQCEAEAARRCEPPSLVRIRLLVWLSSRSTRMNVVAAGGRRIKEERAAARERGPPSMPPRFHWPHISPDASASSAVARGNHAAASQPVHQRLRRDSASTHSPPPLSLSALVAVR